jgi:hypothetical protein
MIHQRHTATCGQAVDRLPQLPPTDAHPAAAVPRRRGEGPRLGLRCGGPAMQPAAMRVIETTWRVWREPLA